MVLFPIQLVELPKCTCFCLLPIGVFHSGSELPSTLFKTFAKGTVHAAEPSRKGFDISLRPQLGVGHC